MLGYFFLLVGMMLSHQSLSQVLFEQQLKLLYKNTVPVISSVQLNQLLGQKASVYLLDVRTHREYAVSHLPGARLMDQESFHLDKVKDIPKKATVVVYCSVGVRSERVGEMLKQAGYAQVHNLYGGIISWKNEGFPVINSKQELTDCVHTYNRLWSVWLRNGIKVYD